MRSFRTSKGFSAIEITIVVVIVGLLTALVVPQLPRAIENQRVKAAEKTLYEIYCAQKRYFLNNGQYAATLAQLDTIVNVPSGFSIGVANNASQLATFAKNNGNYSLVINSSGNINCSGASCSGLTLNTTTGGSTQPGGGTCQGGNGGGTGGVGTDPGTGGVGTDPGTGDVPTPDDPIEEPDPGNGGTGGVPTVDDPLDPITEPDPNIDPIIQETYNKLIELSDSNPEELAKWIEENPDMWQKLLEQYPELEEIVQNDSPLTKEELESTYNEVIRMLESSPDEFIKWVEENPQTWEQLTELYPELKEYGDKLIGVNPDAECPIDCSQEGYILKDCECVLDPAAGKVPEPRK
ncbi:MAG TPA: hypothetical protein PKO44_03945 [Candidatus Omnitrophota bacterium]|nr:hypothetical protein [Candidatus Omnitrophota bacterium]